MLRILLDLSKAEYNPNTNEYKFVLGNAVTDKKITNYIYVSRPIEYIIGMKMLRFDTTWVLTKMLELDKYLDVYVKELSERTAYSHIFHFRYKVEDIPYYLYDKTDNQLSHMEATTLDRTNLIKIQPTQLTTLTLRFNTMHRISPYLLKIDNLVQSGPTTITLTTNVVVDVFVYFQDQGFTIEGFTTDQPSVDAAIIQQISTSRYNQLTRIGPTTFFWDNVDISGLIGNIIYDNLYVNLIETNKCIIPVILYHV